jgi:hypothetical protein
MRSENLRGNRPRLCVIFNYYSMQTRSPQDLNEEEETENTVYSDEGHNAASVVYSSVKKVQRSASTNSRIPIAEKKKIPAANKNEAERSGGDVAKAERSTSRSSGGGTRLAAESRARPAPSPAAEKRRSSGKNEPANLRRARYKSVSEEEEEEEEENDFYADDHSGDRLIKKSESNKRSSLTRNTPREGFGRSRSRRDEEEESEPEEEEDWRRTVSRTSRDFSLYDGEGRGEGKRRAAKQAGGRERANGRPRSPEDELPGRRRSSAAIEKPPRSNSVRSWRRDYEAMAEKERTQRRRKGSRDFLDEFDEFEEEEEDEEFLRRRRRQGGRDEGREYRDAAEDIRRRMRSPREEEEEVGWST